MHSTGPTIGSSWIVEGTASVTHDSKHLRATHLSLTILNTVKALLRLVRDLCSIEVWHWIRYNQLHKDAHR